MSLKDTFKDLETYLLEHYDGVGSHGVPFVMVLYPPEKEYECREEVKHLVNKFDGKDHPVHEIQCNKLLFQHLDEKGFLEKVFDLEKKNKSRLNETLKDNYYDATLKAISKAEETAEEGAILFVSHVPSLYPLVNVSTVLKKLENEVSHPLVVFYPGKKTSDGKLELMNKETTSNYYRAKIIE